MSERNLKIIISYNGTAYHGFQIQNNAVTVQGTVETALTKLFNTPIHITGCGRTDAGVHARAFCFNMKVNSVIPCDGIIRGLNALLPSDIAVHSCDDLGNNSDFHARYSAKSKEYVYLIHNGKVRDVFMRNLTFFYPRVIDMEILKRTAELFEGEHDFSAYCKAESLETVKAKKHGTVRTVHSFNAEKSDDYIKLTISGNGFLHNMVRIISGTLIGVNEGKITLDEVRNSLFGKTRECAGITLPAHGLYLNKVVY